MTSEIQKRSNYISQNHQNEFSSKKKINLLPYQNDTNLH